MSTVRVESLRAILNDLLTTRKSLVTSLLSTTIDYQAHVEPSLELYRDRIKSALKLNVSRDGCLLVRHCVLALRQLLITRFELLCNSIQLESHVRFAFNELCSLLDLARDTVNRILDEVYGRREIIEATQLLDILLASRRRAVVNKVTYKMSDIEKIARQESNLLRTVCAALLTLLPPPSWGGSVTSYILREGLDTMDDEDWTNFLMPGINSQIFRDYVAMTTSKFWRAVSQNLVAMDHVSYGLDHVSCSGISATNICDIATSKELEMYTTLSCTLLYAGVQLQRHGANRNHDYETCKISSLLLTDKCQPYGSHGNTVIAYTIVNDLLQPTYSILATCCSASHAHFTNCLQANAIPVKIHVLRGVANVLQDCSQWYHSQLHRHISNWQLQPLLLLLMGDLPLLLNYMQQQLLPLVDSHLVGVANQLQILIDDAQREQERLTKQCALIREFLSSFMKYLYESLIRRYQQSWKQPIKLAAECTPTEPTKEAVELTLLPCVKACTALPPTTREPCVTFFVTVTIDYWRNYLLSNGQRYSKQHFCQLLSDYTYMVSSASHDPTNSTIKNCINCLPVVMETREALYKLCGIYHDDEYDRSCDPASYDPIVTEIINILPEGISTHQWATSMATRKK